MSKHQDSKLRPQRNIRAGWSVQRIIIVVVAILGVGVMLYPTAAAWFSDRVHATEISGYVDTVENLSPSAQKTLLDEARQFNKELPSGPLRDPYSLNNRGEKTVVGSARTLTKKYSTSDPAE